MNFVKDHANLILITFSLILILPFIVVLISLAIFLPSEVARKFLLETIDDNRLVVLLGWFLAFTELVPLLNNKIYTEKNHIFTYSVILNSASVCLNFGSQILFPYAMYILTIN